MTKNIGHICNLKYKWCLEGADPRRHPNHNTHKGGCICSLGDLTDVVKSAKLEASQKTSNLLEGD